MEDIEPLINGIRNENEADVPKKVNVEMDVDEVLAAAGGFGRAQFILLILCMFFSVSFSYQALSMYYAADDPPWQCTSNATSDFCKNHHNQSVPESSDIFEKRCQNPLRHEWEYTKLRKYSLVTEFNLVCEKKYLKALTTSCFFIGCIVGSIAGGPITDGYGRKVTVVLSVLMMAVVSFSSSFVTAIWQMIFLRALIGFAFGAAGMAVYIILSECNPPKLRGTVCNVYFVAFTISNMILTGFAYFLSEWRLMLLYFSFFACLSFILSLGLLESPNWLVSKGRPGAAMEVLMKISKINKKPILGIVLKLPANVKETNSDSRNYSYLDFVKNLKVFVLVFVQCFLWMAAGLMFYGIALESSNLGGDIYFNFVLSTMADVPGYILVILTSIYVGRKKTVCVSFLISSAMVGAIGFVPEKLNIVRVILAVGSRILINILFSTMFLWSFEIFPTVLRSQGMNVCQVFTRGGGAAAPFITDVLKDVNPSLPFFIMAGVGIISAIMGLVLPETFKKPIRQTYEDMLEGTTSSSVAVPVTNSDFDEGE